MPKEKPKMKNEKNTFSIRIRRPERSCRSRGKKGFGAENIMPFADTTFALSSKPQINGSERHIQMQMQHATDISLFIFPMTQSWRSDNTIPTTRPVRTQLGMFLFLNFLTPEQNESQDQQQRPFSISKLEL